MRSDTGGYYMVTCDMSVYEVGKDGGLSEERGNSGYG